MSQEHNTLIRFADSRAPWLQGTVAMDVYFVIILYHNEISDLLQNAEFLNLSTKITPLTKWYKVTKRLSKLNLPNLCTA